jgi:hypothetical protein
MRRLEGELEVGARLDVQVLMGKREMAFHSTVVHVDEGRAFRWLGPTFVRGIFDGEHAFELEPLGDGRTRLVHSERFHGILAWLVLGLVGRQTEAGFRAMNQALKERCETPRASVPSSV